jgi:hypothetical protein
MKKLITNANFLRNDKDNVAKQENVSLLRDTY